YTGGGRAIFARTPVPNSDGNIGRVDAIKLADRSTVWTARTRTPQTGAVLPTAGGVVFGGGWDRLFRAYDDATGKVLWETKLNNALNSFPVTYSVNGKQYVAVVAGNGSSHARSLATLTPEIKNPDGGSVLGVRAAGLTGALLRLTHHGATRRGPNLSPLAGRGRRAWRRVRGTLPAL